MGDKLETPQLPMLDKNKEKWILLSMEKLMVNCNCDSAANDDVRCDKRHVICSRDAVASTLF